MHLLPLFKRLIAMALTLLALHASGQPSSWCEVNRGSRVSGTDACIIEATQQNGTVHGASVKFGWEAGTVRTFAYTPNRDPASDYVAGMASLYDEITINGDLQGIVVVPVTLRLTGAVSGAVGGSFQPRINETRLYNRSDDLRSQAGALIGLSDGNFYYETGEWTWGEHRVDVISSDVSNIIVDFTIYAPVTRDQPVISLTAFVQAWSYAGTTSSSAFDAQFAIGLPPGLSFVSSSGFMSQPVPEPQTWALMLMGAAIFCLIGRSKRAHALREGGRRKPAEFA